MGPTSSASPDGAGDPGAGPRDAAAAGRLRLVAVAVVLGAQAVGLLAFSAYLLVNLVGGTKQTTATSNTVIETVVFALCAVLLGLLARGCVLARRWARAPVMVVELIALLGVGRPMLQGDLWYRYLLGIPISAGAVVAIVLMLTPSVTAALYADVDLDD